MTTMDSRMSHAAADSVAPPGRARRGLALLRRTLVQVYVQQPLGALVSPDAQAGAERALRIARQQRDAAGLLLARGSTSEALRLARDAARAYAEAGAALAPALKGHPELEGQLARLPKPEDVTTSLLDADMTPREVDAARALLTLEAAVDRPLATHAQRPREAARVDRGRVLGTVALAAALAFAFWLRGGIHAHPSAVYSPSFPGVSAVDGDIESEWLLPNGEPGWLDVTFGSRRVYHVDLLNAHNHTFNDRAAREVHLEAFSHGKRIWDATRAFTHVGDHDWQRFELDGVRCDRLRVEVRSFFGSGGGLAEVVVE